MSQYSPNVLDKGAHTVNYVCLAVIIVVLLVMNAAQFRAGKPECEGEGSALPNPRIYTGHYKGGQVGLEPTTIG